MLRRGFTLLEVMLAVAIMTIVFGVLAGLSLGIGNTASAQRARTTATEEARRALQTLAARLHAASAQSVNTANLPGSRLTFRVAADVDGNGTAVNVNGRLELGAPITVGPDTADANRDGVTERQLIMTQGNTSRVLCNNLPPDSAVVNNGVPLVRGFWVVPRDGGLDITVQTESRDNRGRPFRVAVTEFVRPRNL